MKRRLVSILPPLLAWSLALVLTSATVLLVGEKPLHVLQILGASAFGSVENVSYTLFYATPLLFTGTAVALALEAGLFNIGAEGQLYIGALCAALWGFATRGVFASGGSSLGVALALGAGALFSFTGGALWGGLAGYLRVKRHVHEVIATIMLNFIAMALVNWVVLNPLKNPETQSLETYWVAEALRVGKMWRQTTYGLPLALVVTIGVLWAIRRTWWGFRTRATGTNETAARLATINVDATAIWAMALSGGIAGLVGFNEVYLNSYRLIDAFSPGVGFTGLAIALLARGSIPGLILSSILFGALYKGALDLDLETEKVTRDLSTVIQALILVGLAAQPRMARFFERWKFTRGKTPQ